MSRYHLVAVDSDYVVLCCHEHGDVMSWNSFHCYEKLRGNK